LRLAWEEMDRFAIAEEASPFFEPGDLELYQGFTIAFIDLGTWKCGMIKKPCTGGCGHLSEVEGLLAQSPLAEQSGGRHRTQETALAVMQRKTRFRIDRCGQGRVRVLGLLPRCRC
jgi:hypothetical protein